MRRVNTGIVVAGLMAAAVLAGTLAWSVSSSRRARPAPQEGGPVVHDERLQLTLFASEPDIATPVGIAVDAADRIFVLESHTHLQTSDYPGPGSDRIKIFVDGDRDGTPERVSVFADGLDDGMNVAFSPAGELYVVTARGMWALHDRDGDGKSLYGGSGIHPYLAWNGELPGTLPFAAALGEAPAGMLVGAGTALPVDYQDDVLVSI